MIGGPLSDIPPQDLKAFMRLVSEWNTRVDRRRDGREPEALHPPPALRIFMNALAIGECLDPETNPPMWDDPNEQDMFNTWFVTVTSFFASAVFEFAQECAAAGILTEQFSPCECSTSITDDDIKGLLNGEGTL